MQSTTENLSPRGLSNTFASNVDELDRISIDNFIQTNRKRRDGDDSARTADKDGKPLQKEAKGKKRGSQKSSQSAQQSNSGGSG